MVQVCSPGKIWLQVQFSSPACVPVSSGTIRAHGAFSFYGRDWRFPERGVETCDVS